jgi:BTB/POZ domain-containing protein 9
MLFGGMKESQLNEIELKDTPLTAFKGLLRYVYMGHMTLGNQKDELILEILGLAHKYGFQDLEVSISDYLKANLSIKNVALVYDMASLYGLEPLLFSCCHFMDRHAVDVIQHESFSNLSGDCVRAIISRDSFCAPEVDIFKAVHNWVQINEATTEEFAQILGEVRLSLMPTQDLLKVVRPTNLVQPDVLLDAIQSRTECRDMELKYRGYLSKNVVDFGRPWKDHFKISSRSLSKKLSKIR